MKHLVMVIEDEEAIGIMLKYNLEKEGFDIEKLWIRGEAFSE